MIEKWDAFPLLYLKDVLILLRQFHIVIVYAPVAQGIEHRPPEAGAAVRIRPGVYFLCLNTCKIRISGEKQGEIDRKI